MIRINLLPVKKARKREAGQRQLLFMGLGVIAAVGVVVFVQISTQNELDAILNENVSLESDIARLKAELGDYDKIKGQREDMLKQRKTIQDLQTKRVGPVYLMREMSEILTANKGPTFNRLAYEERLRRDPNAGFNSAWDVHRVWIDTFDEDATHKVKIKGTAKANDDVSEFSKRLQLSVFFSDVQLESMTQATMAGVEHVTFNLSAVVTY